MQQLILVTYSTLHLGVASPGAAAAGAALGACVAVVLHLALVELGHSTSGLKRVIVFLEDVFGTVTVDTVLHTNTENASVDRKYSAPHTGQSSLLQVQPPSATSTNPQGKQGLGMRTNESEVLVSGQPLSMGYVAQGVADTL